MLHVVKEHFEESIAAKKLAMNSVADKISKAADEMVNAINNGGKIYTCGNGGSAADAQHFSAELLNRFEIERRPLPSVALSCDTSTITSIGNDYSYDLIFAKQVAALAGEKDILLAISTSGNSKNIIEAINQAHINGTTVVALTGKDGGKITPMLKATDVNICVPVQKTSRIQEIHILAIHCLCDLIDKQLFESHSNVNEVEMSAKVD